MQVEMKKSVLASVVLLLLKNFLPGQGDASQGRLIILTSHVLTEVKSLSNKLSLAIVLLTAVSRTDFSQMTLWEGFYMSRCMYWRVFPVIFYMLSWSPRTYSSIQWKIVPLTIVTHSPLAVPALPGTHQSTFCLYEFSWVPPIINYKSGLHISFLISYLGLFLNEIWWNSATFCI